MIKEVAVGVGLGGLAFLAFQGYNVMPVFFLAGLLLILSQTASVRGMTRKFASAPAAAPQISFDDIGGQASAKKELAEALDFMVSREMIKKLGIRPLKGILLMGPPGTGKTLLAKAAANYTNSAFLAASGSEFIEMYAGVGAQRVRELFNRGREIARREGRQGAVIFIDEIEVLGGKRGQHHSHLEYDQTLNQLLVEMDGISIDEDVNILVVGATNRVDLLDPALTRPGRFDRIVNVDLPDREGRLQILKLHCRNKPLAPGVDLDLVARETFGFSGAHLESLTNEAAILAMREGKDEIEQKHLIEAVDKVILGEKMDRRPGQEEKRRIAIHEAGHAVISELAEPGSVASVTITPRGKAMGYVRHSPGNDRYLYTRRLLEDQIRVCLAGALAEELILGERSTGSSNDFEKAMVLAHRIVSSGLSDLGVVDEEFLTKAALSAATSEIIRTQEEIVRKDLAERRSALERVADLLMQSEAIGGEELRSCLEEAA